MTEDGPAVRGLWSPVNDRQVQTIRAHRRLSEQPQNDQYEDDDEQDMNEIPGLRNPRQSCGPEISQKPKDDEDDNEKFEHERILSISTDARPGHRLAYPRAEATTSLQRPVLSRSFVIAGPSARC